MTTTIALNSHCLEQLRAKAKDIRRATLELAIEHKNGHVAAAFSTVELLVALYYGVMGEHDRFVLSKGHGSLSLFAVLRDKGFKPHICGHPDIDRCNGVECTSGSLGHGIAIAAGKAFAKKLKGEPGTVYVVVGDGECQEGSVWETLNIARRFKLDNFVVIVDHNKLQALDAVAAILDETNLRGKFESFGCAVREVDGHDIFAVYKCLSSVAVGKPCVVIAHTIKGKGISFMENVPMWHVRQMNDIEIAQARKELE
jgi:transketolase